MHSRLPPLQTLRAFEATGRLLSMSQAAAELHVTAGAISRQIRTLEEDLGVVLFRRMAPRIALTEEGVTMHEAVSQALVHLTREADRLRMQKGAKRLTVSTSVSFASKWFAPRLHRLVARLPDDVDIHLEVSDVNVDLSDGRVAAAIRYGTGSYPNTPIGADSGGNLHSRLQPTIQGARGRPGSSRRPETLQAAARATASA
jgi:LysR family glycine cleavage system transcriptional activator